MIQTIKHIHSIHFAWTPTEPWAWKDVCLKGWNKSIHCHPYTRRNNSPHYPCLALAISIPNLTNAENVNQYWNTNSGFCTQTLHSPTHYITAEQLLSEKYFSTHFFPFIEPLIQWLSLHYLWAQSHQNPYACVGLKCRHHIRAWTASQQKSLSWKRLSCNSDPTCEHTSSKGAKQKSKLCFLFLPLLQAQLNTKKPYNSKAGSISKPLLYA